MAYISGCMQSTKNNVRASSRRNEKTMETKDSNTYIKNVFSDNKLIDYSTNAHNDVFKVYDNDLHSEMSTADPPNRKKSFTATQPIEQFSKVSINLLATID
jgi:hypothetical protein